MNEPKEKAEAVQGIGTREGHARLLLESYKRLTGKKLVEPIPGRSLMEAIDEAPIVVLSHGTEADPVLNYGNRMALRLWEMDEVTFALTPSRLTAEPMNRDARAQLPSKGMPTVIRASAYPAREGDSPLSTQPYGISSTMTGRIRDKPPRSPSIVICREAKIWAYP